jgi:tRNA-2-methylthio-N6-dimethylallyladenosine synthase
MEKKAYIKAYGCQMNMQDALQMKGILSKMGYENVEDSINADLVLFVTCSIREKAVHKVYSDIGRLRAMVEGNPDMIIGLAGCVAQQEKKNLFTRFPYLDLVFGPDAIKDLPQLVDEVVQNKSKDEKTNILQTKFNHKKDFEFVNLVVEEENKLKAYVNIQKGCDNVCAFCIVPRVRGGEVSRPHQEIIDEVKALVDMGVKDITLLGQNVNSYGLKDKDEISFAKLLEKIALTTGIERLRFTTSHPKDVKDDLISLFGELKNLSPNFHLPIQSGSNRILELMRRQYTREEYLLSIEKLRKVRPEITFTSDFIIGFPGENDDDFEQTMSVLNEVEYDSSFSFIYSPRPGTTAIKLEDNVPLEVKKERLMRFQQRQREIAILRNKSYHDREVEVLVEDIDEITRTWKGRTDCNKLVLFADNRNLEMRPPVNLVGKTVGVKITDSGPHSLKGECVNG